MFGRLGTALRSAVQRMGMGSVITQKDIERTLREIRVALLEADVALPVIKAFLGRVQEQALGKNIVRSLRPDQVISKIVYDETLALVNNAPVQWAKNSCILAVGLQGSGKTTLCGKLAFMFQTQKISTLLVSLDPYRPAAQTQLTVLGHSIGVDVLSVVPGEDVYTTAKRALTYKSSYEHVIFDTAGRLHVDTALMQELTELQNILRAKEVLLVCDSLIGQSITEVIKAFSQFPLTGIALSKLDANHKAGVILSLKSLLNLPIKILGTGEKPQDFMLWDAKRIVNRILDQGDLTELVEKTTQALSKETQAQQLQRLRQGIFTLDDLILQMNALQKMGGLSSLLKLIPGMGTVLESLQNKDTSFKKEKAILSSMTPKERKDPKILDASRKRRVAKGSGTTVQDINQLLTRFGNIKKILGNLPNKR
ncbi:signal recognition particle protein [Holospora curviuscula]|uniref:signal-recognition-particle GTPase n=1 Tax=Holospora curviuscula TaxID=1082868 RepID=A0A2S5REE0_9PROT|nr:signal recognition particle receptor subunit alpha [Holospora curviuscula]PPE05582.1 Signal recognition particle protein [Holospora curviuscula]